MALPPSCHLPRSVIWEVCLIAKCLSNHITSLCRSINWQIRNISRIRRFIDFDTCANTVRALILSRLDYCNLLLNNITQKDLTRLQKLQNKCARLIYQQPRSCHVTPLLTELHWLPIADRITFKTLLCVYKSLNGLNPGTCSIVLWSTLLDLVLLPPVLVITAWILRFLRLENVLETGPTQWQLPGYGTIYLSTFAMHPLWLVLSHYTRAAKHKKVALLCGIC